MRASLPRSLAALTCLVVVTTLTACTGDDDTDPDPERPSTTTAATTEEETAEAPPAIPATWQQPALADDLFVDPTVVGEVLLDGTRSSVRGIDLTTGEVAWTATMPEGLRLCQLAGEGTTGGLVGVLLQGRGRPCTVVGALDTATGELAWTREVEGERPYHEGRSVATGSRTVAATFNCDEMRRFRATDGTPLGIIGAKDRKCAMEAATDGHVVFALNDPETSETPDDLGTGWIPPHDAEGAYELWDLDSGRLRWRRPIPTTRGASVEAIVSSTGASTVLAFGEGSTITMRVVDRRGRPGAYLGRRLGYNQVPIVVGEADGVVVLRYDAAAASPLLFGYDVATGEELWHLVHPGAAAVVDGGLVLGTDAYLATPGTSGVQTWLTRADLRDPTDAVTLGSVPGQMPVFIGDRVLVDGGLYPLPTEGEDRVYDVPRAAFEPAWGEDDLTTEDVLLACDAVGSTTLQLLGVDHPDLPRPSDCDWRDSSDPTYLEQHLDVSVQAVAPGRGGASYDEELTGPEMATDQVEQQIERAAESSYDVPIEPVSLPGLGEQAWMSDPAEIGLLGPSVRLIVRWRNVLVDVTASQETEVDNRRYGAVPDDQVPSAALAAVADVLAGLGAPAESRVVPSTPTTDAVVPSVCRTLRDEAATLVPGIRPSDQTPRGDGSTGATRQSACVWWGPDEDEDAPDLAAMVHVVPASPLGTSAEETARELLPGGFDRTRPVAGLPGVRARFFRYVGDSGYRSVAIYAIKGDTIVVADHTVPTGGLTRAEGDRIIVRVARKLFASAQR